MALHRELLKARVAMVRFTGQTLGCMRVQILPLVQSAVACRLELHGALPGNKDLLYLDLALEGVVRSAMERGIGSLGMGACAFVGPLLQNLVRPPLPPSHVNAFYF